MFSPAYVPGKKSDDRSYEQNYIATRFTVKSMSIISAGYFEEFGFHHTRG